MDSDGTLAKVTYLPGVKPPHAVANEDDATASEGDGWHAEARHAEMRRVEERHAEVPSESRSLPVFETPLEPPLSPEKSAQRTENISLSALTRRGRSRWELGEVLRSRDVDPALVEEELDRLERVGLLDDAALAETIVRTQHERKGLGRSALVNEMRRKHIDQDTIDIALEQLGDDDEFRRAVELAERRVNQLRGLDHATAVRRLSGYLQRKGYAGDTVRRAILETLPKRSSGVSFS